MTQSNKKRDRSMTAVGFLGVGVILLWVASATLPIVIVAHFVIKYW